MRLAIIALIAVVGLVTVSKSAAAVPFAPERAGTDLVQNAVPVAACPYGWHWVRGRLRTSWQVASGSLRPILSLTTAVSAAS
jgi:hypothetical protein